MKGADDKTAWCSSFVDWTLRQAGIAGTGSAWARSWLEWGSQIEIPVYGCITILWRESPESWKGHVGFFVREEEDCIVLLSGNELDEVREYSYPRERLLGYRWPSDLHQYQVDP
jgi:uncharacterized protein (TIGR02594 family)